MSGLRPGVSALRAGAALRAERRHASPATLVLAGLMAAAALLLLYAGRHLTFFYDEWSFILDRRGGSLHAYLSPHNGHLSLVPVAIYKALFAIVGLRHYLPYRAVDVALHLVCVGLLYVLARRRLGPWIALVPSLVLLFLGSAWQDLLWPFQIGYLGSVAAGLGAIALLDRERRPREGWASALLVVAVCSSGVGLAFVGAAATLLLVTGSPLRRMWIAVVPIAVFIAWYIGWGTGEHITSASLLGTPQFVADAAATGVAGIAGLSSSWGPPLATAGLIALVLGTRRRAPVPMLIAASVGAIVFWVLVGVTRADPTASRYVYVSAAFVLVIAVAAVPRVTIRGVWLAVAGAILAGMLIANLDQMRLQERGLRTADDRVRAELRGLEIAAPVVGRWFAPDPTYAPAVTAARYLAAVRDLGSPALSLQQLERAPESGRLQADAVLVAAEHPAAAASVSASRCAAGASSIVVAPGQTLFAAASRPRGAQLFVRRFADQLQPSPIATTGVNGLSIHFAADGAPTVPWRVVVKGTSRELCAS